MSRLIVSGNTETRPLAQAIVGGLKDAGAVEVSSIGANASHSSVRGLILAREFINRDGKDISFKAHHETVRVNNVEKTAVVFSVTIDGE